jgi:malonyl-CoA O-methyltransferase
MLAKTKIKQAFAAASQTYDDVAALQRQVGRTLWQQLGELPINTTLLDIGCGTGFMLTELVNKQQVLPYFSIALDIAEPMLSIAQQNLIKHQSITYLCADAERLPLQDQSVDIVISNLALQWCRNLADVFNDINRILKPGGIIGFSTFGAQTLQELKTAWQTVDAYQHVNDFFQAEEVSNTLRQAGFTECSLAVVNHQASYPSVYELMTELKQLGAHTVIDGHNPKLTSKTAMQRMVAAYERQTDGGSIPATFEIISIIAKRAG